MKLRNIKRILLFTLITFLLSSCWWEETNKTNVITSWNDDNIKIDSNDIEALNDLINKQEFDKVLPILKKNYEDAPENINNMLIYLWTLANMGTYLREEAKYSEIIIKLVEKWIKIHPNNSELYRVLWYAYEMIQDYENAFLNYDKSIKLNDNNTASYIARGHAFRLIWEYKKAENDFNKAYKLDDTVSENLINLATIYLYKGELDKAYNMYEESLKNTDSIRYKWEALSAMWDILRSKEDFKWAKDNFNRAIKEDPEFELGYMWLGYTLLWEYENWFKGWNPSIDLLKKSEESIKLAIEKNPNKALSYIILWWIYFDLSEMDKASKYIIKWESKIDDDITLGKMEKENLIKDINSIKKSIIDYNSLFIN